MRIQLELTDSECRKVELEVHRRSSQLQLLMFALNELQTEMFTQDGEVKKYYAVQGL